MLSAPCGEKVNFEFTYHCKQTNVLGRGPLGPGTVFEQLQYCIANICGFTTYVISFGFGIMWSSPMLLRVPDKWI